MTEFSKNLSALLHHAAGRYDHHGSDISAVLAGQLREAALNTPETVAEVEQAPAAAYLAEAMAANDWAAPKLRDALGAIADDLPWRARMAPKIGLGFDQKYAAVELVGNTGLIPNPVCRFGLFLMVPDVFYPSHQHAAEELYVILSGTADWQKDAGEFAPLPPGGFAHHTSWQPHATKSTDQPLLAFWGWTGNLDFTTYRML